MPQVLHTVRPVCLVSVVILSKKQKRRASGSADGFNTDFYKVSRAFRATFKPEKTISAGKYPKLKHL